MLSSAEFWNRTAPSYSKQPIADPENYARKLQQTQSYMRPDMEVVEFGCGTGSTALYHAECVKRIVATDVSDAMLEVGRQRAAESGIENVIFKTAGIEDYEAEPESVDMVLALNLLHLVPNKQAALKKIQTMLKPGGIFVSSTVCLGDRMWFLRPLIPVLQWLGKAPYVSFLNADHVRKEIEFAGFSLQEQWVHGNANSLFVIAKKA
jgi:ubiquinone/menaquinone biosynthesis C-methylase UbiE